MTTDEFIKAAPHCLPPRIARWARELAAAALVANLDPFLLAAVMDRETNGRNILGDGGHGHGLMQVDDRYHTTFCAAQLGRSSKYLWEDAAFSCLYGARLLEDNLRWFGGDVLPAVAAYNASASRVRAALSALPPGASAAQRLAAVDSVTTGRNYVSDVLRRRDQFLAALPPRAV